MVQSWHLALSSDKLTLSERIVTIAFFAGLTSLCAQVAFAQAYAWGVEPFLLWDFAKILVMLVITTKAWSYSSFDEETEEGDKDIQTS